MKTTRFVLLFFLLLFVMLLPYFVLAQNFPGESLGERSAADQGLIPCGRTGQPACQTCHLFVLGQNILNFVWYLTIPIATLALIYAGFLMIIPTSSTERLTKGRKVLTNTLIGVAIVFFAWLGIDTIIKIIADQNLTSGEPAQIQGLGPWNKIECREVPISTYQSSGPTLVPEPVYQTPPYQPLVAGDAESVGWAQAILAEQLINFSTKADCGGNNNARGTMDTIAAGNLPPVCSPSCDCKPGGVGGNVNLSKRMLFALDAASRVLKFEVTSLTTGKHKIGSAHYQGKGADLVLKGNTTYVQLENRFRGSAEIQQGADGQPRVFCEDGGGNTVLCSSGGVNHLHVEFK